MLKTFIERPVLSTVISVIVVILGVLGLTLLPVTQYPDIAPPTVNVSASYTGANAETVMESVIIPIEEQINGVEGMTYMTSTATDDGRAQIQVFFEQGVDPDIAAVNVQNRVARANALLPQEVIRAGVTTQKQITSALMFLTFYTTDSEKVSPTYLQNYLDINVIPAIKRVDGVGEAQVFGGHTYSMRVWIDPDKLAVYNLEPNDVIAAINEQSREAAAGQVGQNNGEAFQYTIKYGGRYKTEEQYSNIVIKALNDGQFLRLADVAKIELADLSYSGKGEFQEYEAVSAGIFQTPGSNAQDIINEIKIELDELSKNFPEGVTYRINYDTNEFLEASINKVIMTFLEASLLVFVVVFIFLQDWRSTLIPMIAVPVSIIGTFFFLYLFGYSLNMLTLFALVLAIGIVVDDAIVVVEAVHAKLENQGGSAKKATLDAMHEIAGAIISITLVMAAVFVPVTFIQGPSGVFYQQFGITLAVAIFISAVNALTLSPALCALFLKEEEHDPDKKRNFLQRFYDYFNQTFNFLTRKYGATFIFLLRHKWVTILIVAASLAVLWYANKVTPSGFVPDEDRGMIFANVELAPGTSLDRTYQAMKELQAKANQVPGVESMTLVTGHSLISGSGGNFGLGFVNMESFEEREGDPNKTVDAIVGQLFRVAATIPDAKMIFFGPPSVPGFGVSSGFEVNVLDRYGAGVKNLDEISQHYIGELMQRPEIQYAQSSFNTNYPQYEMEIDINKAKQTGVSVSNILAAMQGYIGGYYAADFSRFGKQYRVMVQSLPEDRKDENSLNGMYVRSSSGQMTPITQFVTLKRVYGPQSINRFNLYTSTAVSGAPTPGYSTGDAINVVREVAETSLPDGYSIDFSGITREEINAGNQAIIILLLSLVFVYFILSAQYESYILPLSVLISLPMGIAGAFVAQNLAGLQNNIYFQIAMIMLIGLLAKNAILIVEFAVQRRRHGETLAMSAINAAKARLRPILMTSFAFILGMMPLVLATGVGATGFRSIGTGAAFGLLIGTLLGLIVIPVLYVIFQWIQEKVSPKKYAQLKIEKEDE